MKKPADAGFFMGAERDSVVVTTDTWLRWVRAAALCRQLPAGVSDAMKADAAASQSIGQ